MAKVIISYRRSDSDVFAGRVRDRIAGSFGENSVFIDVDNIPFGTDFRDHIQKALAKADAVLVVVGPKWLGISKGGQSRITNDTDPVRIEVETALSKGIPTIPILVGKTDMPRPEQLPESIRSFAFINAAPVDTGRDFHRDLSRVIATINTILEPADTAAGDLRSSVFTAGPEQTTAAQSIGARTEAAAAQSRPIKRPLVIGSLSAAAIIAAVGVWFVVARPTSVGVSPMTQGIMTQPVTPLAPVTSTAPPAVAPVPVTPTPPAFVQTEPAMAADPGADVVRAFYTALGRGDGATASKLVVPERQTGHFDPQAMTKFFSSLSKPLQSLGVEPAGQNSYQATYTYVATTKVCNNSVVVSLTKRNAQYLIQNIDSRGGC